jgi:hypothetical protein
MKRKASNHYTTSTETNNSTSNHSVDQSTMFASSGRGGGASRGGRGGSARNSNHNKRPKLSTAKAPIALPPLHDMNYIKSCWAAYGGIGPPNPKWLDNSKGIIANYLTTLGESVTYKAGKAQVGSFIGFRSVDVLSLSLP